MTPGSTNRRWGGKWVREGKAANKKFVIKLVIPRGSWTLILLGWSGSQERTHASEIAHPRGEGAGVFTHQSLSHGWRAAWHFWPTGRVGKWALVARKCPQGEIQVMAIVSWTGTHWNGEGKELYVGHPTISVVPLVHRGQASCLEPRVLCWGTTPVPYQRTSTLFIRDLPQIYWLKIMTIYLAPKSVGGQYGLTLTVLFWYQLGSLVHLWPAGRWAGLR